MPASPVLATLTPATFVYTSAANAPVGINPQGIAAADLNGDSRQDLVVANCFNDTVSVLMGNGNGTFTPAPGSPITVGTCPEVVVLTDLNGDGKQDFVVSNYNDNTVSVFLGNGGGGFTPKAGSPFAAGSTPNDLAVGDVTGDGKKDIVVTNTTTNTVSVLAGNGSGGFGAPTAIATGSQPLGVALGDVDGTHGLDILVTNSGGNTVSVLLNNGSGAFSPAPGSPITVGNSPQLIALGKINADNALDFVVANYSDVTNPNDGSVSVFLGNGNGTFTQAAGSPIVIPNTSPVAIALDFLNADANLDLVVSDSAGFGTYVLTGNGNGTFSAVPAQPTITGGAFPISIAVADVNGYNRKDILTANQGDNDISVSLGNGAGAFTTISPPFPFSRAGSGGVLGDFNGDGKPDIATSGGAGTLFVNLGLGNGTFNTVGPYTVGGVGVPTVVTGDVNGDGKQDIVYTASGSPTMVTVLLGDGHGGFAGATGSPFSTGGSCPASVGLVVADLNGDGKQDIAVTDCNGPAVDLFISTGTGTFTAGTPITGFTGVIGAAFIAAADLRGLGRQDLIVTGTITAKIWVLLNDGLGAFSNAPGSPLPTTHPVSLILSDVNHDGKPDLLVGNSVGGVNAHQFVDVRIGNGNGTFQAAISSPSIVSHGSGLAVGDLNGDGHPDIVAVGQTGFGCSQGCGNLVDVLLGNGDGTFVTDPGSPFPTGYYPNIPLIADLNGDGKRDIAVVGIIPAVLRNTTGILTPLPSPKPSGPVGGLPNPRPIPPQPSVPAVGVPNPLPPPRP